MTVLGIEIWLNCLIMPANSHLKESMGGSLNNCWYGWQLQALFLVFGAPVLHFSGGP